MRLRNRVVSHLHSELLNPRWFQHICWWKHHVLFCNMFKLFAGSTTGDTNYVNEPFPILGFLGNITRWSARCLYLDKSVGVWRICWCATIRQTCSSPPSFLATKRRSFNSYSFCRIGNQWLPLYAPLSVELCLSCLLEKSWLTADFLYVNTLCCRQPLIPV